MLKSSSRTATSSSQSAEPSALGACVGAVVGLTFGSLRIARDRRAHMVAVTKTGRRVLRESHRRMVAAFTRVLDGWSDEDVNALTSGLERLREDFARLSAAPTSHQKEAA